MYWRHLLGVVQTGQGRHSGRMEGQAFIFCMLAFPSQGSPGAFQVFHAKFGLLRQPVFWIAFLLLQCETATVGLL